MWDVVVVALVVFFNADACIASVKYSACRSILAVDYVMMASYTMANGGYMGAYSISNDSVALLLLFIHIKIYLDVMPSASLAVFAIRSACCHNGMHD